MLRQRMRCDTPSLSLADYDFIIQCRNDRPRTKVLNKLKEKYSISQKRIYQIWRGDEKNRVAWDQPILPFDFAEEGRENSEKKNLNNKSIPPSSDLSREGGIGDQGADQEADLSQEDRGYEDLIRFYEREAIRDKKNIAKLKSILALPSCD